MAFLLQAEAPGAVSLAGGYPHPSLLPNRALGAALARAARRPDASERPPPPPLLVADTDGRVVHIASLTKATSPNLRVGALIARGPVAERLRALRLVDDFFVPRVLQEAALELVSAPAWRAHRTRLAAALTARRTALLVALTEQLPEVRVSQVPAGGLSLWAQLPDHVDDLELAARARDAGVFISPGRPYFSAEPTAANVRLSFAAVRDIGELSQGIHRLATALRACLSVR